MSDDKRLIEDYLPIVAISAEASRKKSVRKGHISTLHLCAGGCECAPLVALAHSIRRSLDPCSGIYRGLH
jgi:putative DNA methylase